MLKNIIFPSMMFTCVFLLAPVKCFWIHGESMPFFSKKQITQLHLLWMSFCFWDLKKTSLSAINLRMQQMASGWFWITAVSLHAGKLRHRFSFRAPVSFPFKRRNVFRRFRNRVTHELHHLKQPCIDQRTSGFLEGQTDQTTEGWMDDYREDIQNQSMLMVIFTYMNLVDVIYVNVMVYW